MQCWWFDDGSNECVAVRAIAGAVRSAVGGGFGRLDMLDLDVMETATECTVITLVSIRCYAEVSGDWRHADSDVIQLGSGSTK